MSNENVGQKVVENNWPDRHPSTKSILKFLVPSPAVRNQSGFVPDIGSALFQMASDIVDTIDQDSPELTAGLRKLLEAKDCFVRAALDERPGFWTDR